MTEPKLPPRRVIDQADWGHPNPYKDYTRWPNYKPDRYVIHWSGSGSDVKTTAVAKYVARRVRAFHVNTRGWSDAAYNAFAWDPALRFRGSNHNGAHKDSDWGGKTFAVYFPTGTQVPVPHRRSFKGFAFMWAINPAPVTGHGLLPASPSGVEQDTQCPGPILRAYIAQEGWLGMLADGTQGERRSWQAQALKYRLHYLGYWNAGYSRFYNQALVMAVTEWQENSGRTPTGFMSRDDWKAIGEQ